MRAPARWLRASIGARAVLAALLAVSAAVLAVGIGDWRYERLDLTARRSNTLDPAVLDVLDKLPEPVAVDVFLRPLVPPYAGIFLEVQDRLQEFLTVLHAARREQVDVRIHAASDFEGTLERQHELGTEGTNKVVFSCGARRAELELLNELFVIDWGNPSSQEQVRYLWAQGIPDVIDGRAWRPGGTFRPPQISEFRGEELITEALLKVASGTSPKAYFLKGHGEPALDGIEGTGLSKLKAALERDGFEVAQWDPLQSPQVPGDCDVLALIGAEQPYAESTRESIRAWTEAGGRVLAAPHLAELRNQSEGGIAALLSAFGMVTRPGLICQALVGLGGEPVEGDEQCAFLWIDERGMQPSHPLTEPMRNRRRLLFSYTPAFDTQGLQSDSGLVLPLITSPAESWRDLPPGDFACNPAQGEKRGRYTLVAVKQLGVAKTTAGGVTQGRVLGVASAYFFDNDSFDTNRDFALNAFNWLAAREYKIKVKPLERSESFLDFSRSTAKPVLTYTLFLGLPGLCAGIGVLIFFLRRRN